LAAAGVKIHTIGVGSPEGTVISHPLTGQEAFTKPDPEFMRKLAQQGQGQFFNLTASESSPDLIMEAIRENTESRLRGNRMSGLKEQYHLFAMLAILLLLVESLIIPLRRESRSL